MKKGFTLVETLVAISILMIAVAGPLTVANKGLNSALYSKNQMIASFLAQESMETIKFIRDSNELAGTGTWIDNLDCVNSVCDVSGLEMANTTGLYSRINCSNGPCQIYLGEKGYTNVSTAGTETIFKRKYELKQVQGSTDCTSSDQECIATVTVSWNERLIPYELKLSSLMTDK